MPKKNPLKLNGVHFKLHQERPTVTRIKTYLDGLPDNELNTNREVMKHARVGRVMLDSAATEDEFANYRQIVIRNRIWGNPHAIAELRRQLYGVSTP